MVDMTKRYDRPADMIIRRYDRLADMTIRYDRTADMTD